MHLPLVCVPLLLLVGCDWVSPSDGETVDADFPDPSRWRLVQLAGAAVPDAAPASLAFEDGAVSGVAACNRYGGDYAAGTGGALAVGPLYGTEIYCGDELYAFEGDYLRALEAATEWDVDGERLRLVAGDSELVFVRVYEVEPSGGTGG